MIEKYAGDAVMAIFGVPNAHEDDPIRAIKAAREIHQLVDTISPEVENKIGQLISMHTGINTGLVVTGEIDMERGTHGIAGDTINLASRLSNLANPGEIVVDVNTRRQVEGHFSCEYRETTTVKGKADPIEVHQILSQRDKPITIRRLSGLRSDLIGRDVEMAELSEAVDNLRQGEGRIFSICGAAGTGKSRLAEEFKAMLDLERIQWIEGHAYAYSQNIPYFPLIDLLNRLLQIEEKDPPEKVRGKIASGLASLVANPEDVIPYVGQLYSINYSEANGSWKLTRSLAESDISSSLHGLIAGRLDRLDKQTKRILQEASVIGRDFLYEILKRITELEDRIDGELSHLERLDLIRTRSLQPDIEYMFKHALTQETAYNGLLKKQRWEIHEQIARVIESVFKDRLAEFNETLAYHFSRGQSDAKAVDYLVKSGEKSLARYAVEEAHQYFKKAYEILALKEELSEAEKIILIDLLNSWAYSYYYLGEFKEFIDIFRSHRTIAESLNDKAKTGMFYAWFGIAHYMAGKSKDSYNYLRKGLELGEKANSQKVVGYACAWLAFTCGELGLFAEGIICGERAQKIAESFPSDQYLFFKPLAGLCLIYTYSGDTSRIFEGAKRLLEYGERNANSRSSVICLKTFHVRLKRPKSTLTRRLNY